MTQAYQGNDHNCWLELRRGLQGRGEHRVSATCARKEGKACVLKLMKECKQRTQLHMTQFNQEDDPNCWLDLSRGCRQGAESDMSSFAHKGHRD